MTKKSLKMRKCKGLNMKKFHNLCFKAVQEEYSYHRTLLPKMMTHTRNIYRSFVYESLKTPMLKKFMNRVIRGTFSALGTITTSIEKKNEVRISKRARPSKLLQTIAAQQVENQLPYILPPEFTNIYSDLMNSLKEQKKRGGSARQQALLEGITGKKIDHLHMKKRPVIKRKSKSTPKSNPPTVELDDYILDDEYTDNDIKLNWKTLMLFSKKSWNTSKTPPIPQSEINAEEKDYFYIGRSDIDGNKVYFRVTKDLIPEDQDSHVFQNSFFSLMGFNTEYDIPPYSILTLKEVVADTPKYAIDKIKAVIVKGKKMFKGKRANGQLTEPQEESWIKKSFEADFDWYYKQLLDDQNLNKFIKVPSGKAKIPSVNDEPETVPGNNIPERFRTEVDVHYCFDNKAYCSFGNMANALKLLGDDNAANFFFTNRHKHMAILEAEHPEFKMNLNGNQYFCALQIIRHVFHYSIRNLGEKHVLWANPELEQGIMKYVEIQPVGALFTHTVVIYNNFIIDGTFKKCIKLSKESFRFVGGGTEHYRCQCYSLEPSKQLKRTLNRLEEEKKKKPKLIRKKPSVKANLKSP